MKSIQTLNTNDICTKYFQIILDSIPEGALFCDEQGTIIMCSTSYALLLGGEVKDIVGKNIIDLNPYSHAMTVMEKDSPDLWDICPYSQRIVNRIPIKNDTGEIIGMFSHVAFSEPNELWALNKKIETLSKKLNLYENTLKSTLKARHNIDSIIGHSETILDVKLLIQSYADEIHPVLIEGRTGTGKELIGQALHSESIRADGPFVSINCAAIPKELFESELFGYASGAFSGAKVGGKIGKIELADKGTLFLDEIGDIPLHAQIKLLRVLEDHCITRVGGVEEHEVDFRLITATNKNLSDLVKEGLFREDLWYRINTLRISLPPLSARVDDIMLIAYHILSRINHGEKKITQRAQKILQTYSWPGNVRQLHNVLVHAAIHCKDDSIDFTDLPEEITIVHQPMNTKSVSMDTQTLSGYLESQEEIFLQNILQKKHGNMTATAEFLAISRMTLYNKLKKYGIRHDAENLPQ